MKKNEELQCLICGETFDDVVDAMNHGYEAHPEEVGELFTNCFIRIIEKGKPVKILTKDQVKKKLDVPLRHVRY